MVLDFVYNTSTWLWAAIAMALACGASCLGLFLFHRIVHLETRRTHNELTGFTVAVISVTYAVLLAFIAIATWDSYSEADLMVENEASYVGSIYRDTQGLPSSMGKDIRSDTQLYLDTVIHQEWPVQRTGHTPNQGWKPLRKIH